MKDTKGRQKRPTMLAKHKKARLGGHLGQLDMWHHTLAPN